MSCKCKQTVPLKFKRLDPTAKLPKYETEGAAGFDLASIENIEVGVGKTVLIHTGMAVEVPEGYELQIRPRSGVSLKTGLMIKNSPGTIDSDYRGEIGIIVYNTGEKFGHYVNAGDRIAQAVLAPVTRAEIIEADELGETVRGEGGFGSTDVKVVNGNV